MRGVPTDRLRPPAAPTLPADLPEEDLARLTLEDDARVEGLELTGAAPPATVARGVTIELCRVRGALAGARLHGLHLHDAELAGADLANLDAREGALQRLTASGCRLTGANLAEAGLRDVALTDCRLDYAVLALARLDRVTFRGCDLREVALDEAILRDVRFERCDLSRASLAKARLTRVTLEGCRLDGVRALGDLRGAAMPWPDVVAHAGAFAAALGIAVLEDDEEA
jgi:uncharacterized protein YjbI with pentapeptide repeats